MKSRSRLGLRLSLNKLSRVGVEVGTELGNYYSLSQNSIVGALGSRHVRRLRFGM